MMEAHKILPQLIHVEEIVTATIDVGKVAHQLIMSGNALNKEDSVFQNQDIVNRDLTGVSTDAGKVVVLGELGLAQVTAVYVFD